MKKLLIAKIRKYGHIAPRFFIHVLAFLLYGKRAFKSRVHWGTQLGDTLSLSPEEALDRLAQKAGVSRKEIKASKLGWAEPEKVFLTDDEILVRQKADKASATLLEKNIADSIKPNKL